MKKIFISIALVVILFFGYLLLMSGKVHAPSAGSDLPNTDNVYKTYTFTCRAGNEFDITYNDTSKEATLLIERDMAFPLSRAVSGSGARYTNEDETVVFWEHAGEARVEMNGKTTYEGCVMKEKIAASYKNGTYSIDGQSVTLIDGIAETDSAPGSSSKVITQYFGNEVMMDLNSDGRDDVVFLLTQNSEGTGTFYYVVAALNTEQGYVGSEGFSLGDRIAPQTTEKGKWNIVVVNYVDRAADESFSVSPSIGKTVWLKLDTENMQFGTVEQDFEGESDLIHIQSPSSNAKVSNPVTVSGEARGMWFFEASFPIVVVDWDGKIIGEGYATADGDWMTEDFVPFTGSITYTLPEDVPYKRGAIIFKKDNPSGLPEQEAAMQIPVMFE